MLVLFDLTQFYFSISFAFNLFWDCGKTFMLMRILGVPTILGRNVSEKLVSAASEAVAQRCSVKKVFLEISQNSKENTCVRVPFLIKRRLWRRCFSVNFEKFLRTTFFTEHLSWLLLQLLFGCLSRSWIHLFSDFVA